MLTVILLILIGGLSAILGSLVGIGGGNNHCTYTGLFRC